MLSDARILAEGLGFPEGPRWHEGKLWFTDQRTKLVSTVDLAGKLSVVTQVAQQPSGLGWTRDNELLIVSMLDRRLLKLAGDKLVEVANLWTLASLHCNDMVVSQEGRAYIGNFGYDIGDRTATPETGEIVMVEPDGSARVVADGLAFPNGTVITPDGQTLIVAETIAARLTAFDMAPDGSLSNRRIWAAFDELGMIDDPLGSVDRIFPDGIVLDADGGIWVASPGIAEGSQPCLLRVEEGGRVTHHMQGGLAPYACMLGGVDGCTLFVVGLQVDGDQVEQGDPAGMIVAFEVDVPKAGWP